MVHAQAPEMIVDLEHPKLAPIVRAMYGPTAIIEGAWLYEGFSDGGSTDLPNETASAAQRRAASLAPDLRLLIVAGSSPLRFDLKYGGHNPKISAKSNAALRLDRAQWFNSLIRFRGDVYPPGLANDRKAVYLVAVRVSAPIPPAVVAPPYERIIVREALSPSAWPDWFRGGLGWMGVASDRIEAGLFSATLSAGWNLSERSSIGAYAGGGLNFGSPNDRSAHAGFEYRPKRHLFVRLGYRSAAVEIPGDGHTLARYEGPEVGIGYRRNLVEAGLYGSRGKYADVDDRRWRDKSLVSFELTLGNPVR